jgi:hypothetical protein
MTWHLASSLAMDAARSDQLHGDKRYRAVPSRDASAFSYHSSHRNTLGNGLIWDTLVEDLATSLAGPLVPHDIVLQCTSPAILSQINDVLRVGGGDVHAGVAASPSAGGGLLAASDVHFYSEVSVPCDDKHVSSYIFTSGHTIVTTGGTYVQLLVPIVVRRDVYDSGGGKGRDAQCIVSEFVPVRQGRLTHPELPVPWIKRGVVKVIAVKDLVRRVHVPPVFGMAHRNAGDTTPHFVVNTLGDPYYAGPKDRLVFQRCRMGNCNGLLLKPKALASMVPCNTCGHACPWF